MTIDPGLDPSVAQYDELEKWLAEGGLSSAAPEWAEAAKVAVALGSARAAIEPGPAFVESLAGQIGAAAQPVAPPTAPAGPAAGSGGGAGGAAGGSSLGSLPGGPALWLVVVAFIAGGGLWLLSNSQDGTPAEPDATVTATVRATAGLRPSTTPTARTATATPTATVSPSRTASPAPTGVTATPTATTSSSPGATATPAGTPQSPTATPTVRPTEPIRPTGTPSAIIVPSATSTATRRPDGEPSPSPSATTRPDEPDTPTPDREATERAALTRTAEAREPTPTDTPVR